jgi:LmbE family N-acetylglucosaminyl deacetylase
MNASPCPVKEAVFVSPHLDDAALSCGGGISRLVSSGTPVAVATICTEDRPADSPISALARRNHASWAAGEAPFERRRREDHAAMAVLGAKPVHLGLLDAVYRTSAHGRLLYRRSVCVPIDPGDSARYLPILGKRLAPILAAHPEARVFCPCGVGGHVDHLLVRAAVEAAVEARRIVYYDDYPYLASKEGAPGSDVGWPGEMRLRLTPAELQARIAAVVCYRSQLRGLFPTLTERALEVLSARTPVLGPHVLPPPNLERSAERAARQISDDVGRAGGERYSWADTGAASPFCD